MESVDIIKTELVVSRYDDLWHVLPEEILSMPSRPVLIIIHSYNTGSFEEQKLNQMLEVCKLRVEQYNIVKLEDGQQISWHKLRNQLSPGFIFLIGIHPTQLGISALFNLNHPNNFNKCVWLPTLSIPELEQNKTIKNQLWNNGMKPLFVDQTFGPV